MPKMKGWHVVNAAHQHIDTVFYDDDIAKEDVRLSLINHDGYDSGITLYAGKPVRELKCTCCGTYARARQFMNQDRGFGLCPKCADWIPQHGGYPPAEMARTYGIRGVHYDLDYPLTPRD